MEQLTFVDDTPFTGPLAANRKFFRFEAVRGDLIRESLVAQLAPLGLREEPVGAFQAPRGQRLGKAP